MEQGPTIDEGLSTLSQRDYIDTQQDLHILVELPTYCQLILVWMLQYKKHPLQKHFLMMEGNANLI